MLEQKVPRTFRAYHSAECTHTEMSQVSLDEVTGGLNSTIDGRMPVPTFVEEALVTDYNHTICNGFNISLPSNQSNHTNSEYNRFNLEYMQSIVMRLSNVNADDSINLYEKSYSDVNPTNNVSKPHSHDFTDFDTSQEPKQVQLEYKLTSSESSQLESSRTNSFPPGSFASRYPSQRRERKSEEREDISDGKKKKNREAARRCRLRKHERIQKLEENARTLQAENRRLETSVYLLKRERDGIREAFLYHINNDCPVRSTVLGSF